MHRRGYISCTLILLLFVTGQTGVARAQSTGTLRGSISSEDQGLPLHNVIVTIVQLKRSAETDDSGAYEFRQVPPGDYTVLAHQEGFPDVVKTARVTAGGEAILDFRLKLSGPREQITVTATGNEQTTFEAIQSVTTLDTNRLAEEAHPSLDEVLDKEPGVAKRSFGPGSSRPVIRGFDGDRVLVLQDGLRTGSVGSQSGDHGEPVDVLSLERVEVVRGPATLLYGSNAIGGVVNAVTGHDFAHEGVRGYLTGVAGTTNSQAGVSGGIEYGIKNWMFWGNGSAQRTGDYDTPAGEIPNSKTRYGSGLGGFGYYGEKSFFSLSYGYDNRRYGIPFAALFEGEEDALIDLDMRRHDVRFAGGLRDLDSFIESFRLTLNYTDYRHREIEGQEVGTVFDNDHFIVRGVFDQRRTTRHSGSFGFWGMWRDYETAGGEALTPPVEQKAFAIFGLQEVGFDRVRFQFGGRLERNRYEPVGLVDRTFTGFSGAAGARFALWGGGAFVANYTHSYRAPALEELYNFGPHIGNLTFEIGNPDLRREINNGLDVSLRHAKGRVRAEANLFYYRLGNFVFLAPAGEVEGGLPVANYRQEDSRYIGTELGLDVSLHRNLWLNLGMDYVDAELEGGVPLPRIPPLRARAGLDFRRGGLSLRPELVIADRQDQVFTNETATAGYGVLNVIGSYSITRQHFAHIFTFNAFNLNDKLYRNHLSFIKELAPEIGRGVRVSYTLRFF